MLPGRTLAGVLDGARVAFGVGEGVSVEPGVEVGVSVGRGVTVGVDGASATGPACRTFVTTRNNPARTAMRITAAPAITPTRSSIALESPTRPRRFFVHLKGSDADGFGW